MTCLLRYKSEDGYYIMDLILNPEAPHLINLSSTIFFTNGKFWESVEDVQVVGLVKE